MSNKKIEKEMKETDNTFKVREKEELKVKKDNQNGLKKVKVKGHVYDVIKYEKDRVLVKIEIINKEGLPETVNQWYTLSVIKPVR